MASTRVSEIIIGIAVVTAHCIRSVCCSDQLSPMPLCAIVVSRATPCAVAARHELSHVAVATTTCPAHGANVIAIKHVLHCVHAEKSVVVRTVVAMEVIIGIFQLEESHIGLVASPANS